MKSYTVIAQAGVRGETRMRVGSYVAETAVAAIQKAKQSRGVEVQRTLRCLPSVIQWTIEEDFI
jgi:hypothetical protein